MTQICKDSSSRPNPQRECCLDLADVLPLAFFRALGDPNRAALVGHLAERGGCCTVGEVAECCPVDVSVVSRHLATLREAGILEAEKRGRKVYYSIRFSQLAEALRSLADAIDACCPPTGSSEGAVGDGPPA